MTVGRDYHTATRLDDGRVLLAGGLSGADADNPLSSAELYDPGTGKFTATGSMSIARQLHTATLLKDGRVLIVGGYDSDDFTGTGIAVPGATPVATRALDPRRTAELYDPKTGTFSPTGSMAMDRYRHTATLLPDGRVLVVGGESLKFGVEATAELYDPRTGTFAAAAPMNTSRTGHTATLLADGDVLIAGGYSSAGLSLASAELYHPASGKFTPTGSMTTARTDHTATLLADGEVLIAGGTEANGGPDALDSAELYDPATGRFTPTGSMSAARSGHTATLLRNGLVLITGSGIASSSGTGHEPMMAELYDPATRSFAPTIGMNQIHDTATALEDGSVLMTGGSIAVVNGSESLVSAEVYRP
jgi:hypothetical protein